MNEKKEKNIRSLKMIFYTIMVPAIVWALFEVIDRSVVGIGVISTLADFKALLRTVLTSFCFCLAMNCNMTSGRMDLSLGAQMYMGCIFGGNLALQLGWGGVGIIILSILIGAICGLLVGLLFINLRILPMVLGIGMTLVFECVSFGAYDQQGLMLHGKQGVGILSDVTFIFVVAVLLLIIMTFLFQYSSYGYKRRAIQGSQKLSADAGINIFVNCVLCYTLAGALAACAGVFDTAYRGNMIPVLGMSSNGNVFSNLFPMFLGILIGSYSNNPVVGILMGSLSLKIVSLGLSKLAMDISWQNIIIYSLFLLFNIYRMNVGKIGYGAQKHKRIALAKKTRAQLGSNAVYT